MADEEKPKPAKPKVEAALETLEKLTVVALAALLVAAQAALSLDREIHFEGFTVKSHLAGMVLFAIMAGVNLQVIIHLQLIRNSLGGKDDDDVPLEQLRKEMAGAEDPWSRLLLWLRRSLAPHLKSRAELIALEKEDEQTALRTSRWIFNPYLETRQRLGFFTDTIGVVALMALWAAGIYMGRHFAPADPSVAGATATTASPCADDYARAFVTGWAAAHGPADEKPNKKSQTPVLVERADPALVDFADVDKPLNQASPNAAATHNVTESGIHRETMLAAMRLEMIEGARDHHKVPNKALRVLFRETLNGCKRLVDPPPESDSTDILAVIVFCCYLLTVLVATSVILLSLRDVISDTRLLRIKVGLVGIGLIAMMILGQYVGRQIKDPESAEHGDFPITYRQPAPPTAPVVMPPTGATTTMPAPRQEDPNAELIKAIQRGDLNGVDNALEKHADPTARDSANRPALILAAELRDDGIVNSIINALKTTPLSERPAGQKNALTRTPLSSQRDGERTALQIAAERGSISTLRLIRGGDNWTDYEVAAAIIAAVNHGQADAASKLENACSSPKDPVKCATIAVAQKAPVLLPQLKSLPTLPPEFVRDKNLPAQAEIARVWLEGNGYEISPEGIRKVIVARGSNGQLGVGDAIELILDASPSLATSAPANGLPPILQAAQQCDRALVSFLKVRADPDVQNSHGENAQTYLNRYCRESKK